MGGKAGHEICFITVRDGQQYFRASNTRFIQNGGAASGSMDGLDIDVVGDAADRVHIVVDKHHIFIFQGKTAGNVKSHFTSPDDNDFQWVLLPLFYRACQKNVPIEDLFYATTPYATIHSEHYYDKRYNIYDIGDQCD